MAAGSERDVEQERGGPVGERLGPRSRGLRLGHEPPDPGQRGLLADGRDLIRTRGVGGDRPGHDAVAGVFGTGRDSPVIIDSSNVGVALDDRAVGRHPAARADEHESPGRSASIGTVARPRRRLDPLGLVGQQRRERLERARRLAERRISSQWPSSITSIKERELPPELEIEPRRALVARLAPNATMIASEISSIMPGCAVAQLLTPPGGTACRRRRR